MTPSSPYEQEFIRLFNAYRSPVQAYIQTVTADRYVAEELTQELFLKLWRNNSRWKDIENMDQYIMRMAHNACMTWFRKLALDARLIREIKNRLQLESNNVENHMAYREAQQLLDHALSTLSPQRRKAFELSRKQGLKLSEIAESMGVSFHTANHHLQAALDHIRQHLVVHARDHATIIFASILLG